MPGLHPSEGHPTGIEVKVDSIGEVEQRLEEATVDGEEAQQQ